MSDYINSIFSWWPLNAAYCLFIIIGTIVCAIRDRRR